YCQEKNRSNHIIQNKKRKNNFEQIIQVNAIYSNETCLEEIIFNVEFDDNYKLEQFEEENIMQTIANIDNFNVNDQITYNNNNRTFH
ncbi:30071_t:CDS:1, partial [Gigaspora margarita]